MARRCWCTTLLDRLRTDPLLRQAPLAVRAVWVELMVIMARAPEPGVLRFAVQADTASVAGWVSGSVSDRAARVVAMLVSCTETEAQTALGWLLANGLLTQETEDALRAPDIVAADARAISARLNGQKGGRPRADGTPAQRRLNLLAVHEGKAASKTQETETQTQPVAAATTTTSLDTSVSQSGASAWVAFGSELLDLVGVDPARSRIDMLPIKAWLDEGGTQETILEAVRAVVARPGYQAGRVRSMMYFNTPVREAIAAARASVTPSNATLGYDREAWHAATQAWHANGCEGDAPLRADFAIRQAA